MFRQRRECYYVRTPVDLVLGWWGSGRRACRIIFFTHVPIFWPGLSTLVVFSFGWRTTNVLLFYYTTNNSLHPILFTIHTRTILDPTKTMEKEDLIVDPHVEEWDHPQQEEEEQQQQQEEEQEDATQQPKNNDEEEPSSQTPLNHSMFSMDSNEEEIIFLASSPGSLEDGWMIPSTATTSTTRSPSHRGMDDYDEEEDRKRRLPQHGVSSHDASTASPTLEHEGPALMPPTLPTNPSTQRSQVPAEKYGSIDLDEDKPNVPKLPGAYSVVPYNKEKDDTATATNQQRTLRSSLDKGRLLQESSAPNRIDVGSAVEPPIAMEKPGRIDHDDGHGDDEDHPNQTRPSLPGAYSVYPRNTAKRQQKARLSKASRKIDMDEHQDQNMPMLPDTFTTTTTPGMRRQRPSRLSRALKGDSMSKGMSVARLSTATTTTSERGTQSTPDNTKGSYRAQQQFGRRDTDEDDDEEESKHPDDISEVPGAFSINESHVPVRRSNWRMSFTPSVRNEPPPAPLWASMPHLRLRNESNNNSNNTNNNNTVRHTLSPIQQNTTQLHSPNGLEEPRGVEREQQKYLLCGIR